MKKIIEKWQENKNWSTMVLGLIVILGLMIRIKRMGDFGMWIDESYMYFAVNRPFHWYADVNPPLYFVMLQGWSRIFGTHIYSLRSFSMVFGLLTIVFAYLATWELSKRANREKSEEKIENKEENKKISRWPALAAALVFAISPFFVDYSVEARNYAMYYFSGVFGLWIFIKAMADPLKWNRWWMWFSIWMGIIFWIHYVGVFLVFGFGVYWIYEVQNKVDVFENIKKVMWHGIRMLLGLAVAVGIWMPKFLELLSRIDQNGSWTPIGSITRIPKNVYQALFGIYPHWGDIMYPIGLGIKTGTWVYIIFVICTGLVLYGLVKSKQSKLLLSVGVGSLLFLIFISQLFGLHIHYFRYVGIYGAILVLLIVWSAAQLPRKFGVGLLALYCFTIGGLVKWKVEKSETRTPTYEKISEFVKTLPGNQILVNDYIMYIHVRANSLAMGDTRPNRLAYRDQNAIQRTLDHNITLWPDDGVWRKQLTEQDVRVIRTKHLKPRAWFIQKRLSILLRAKRKAVAECRTVGP